MDEGCKRARRNVIYATRRKAKFAGGGLKPTSRTAASGAEIVTVAPAGVYRLTRHMEASDARGASGSLPIVTGKKLMLFAGRANPELAGSIAHKLAIELGHITLKTFSAGEVYCRFDESVRGADVFIVQPTCSNPETGVTANDAMMELLVMIDAAVGASAHRVIAVMPWYGYSRQDKKSALREPITARLVAQLLETAGVDRVLTIDLHAGQVQGFFRKPVDHMTALLLIADYFRELQLDDLVVVAPDVGRVKLNHKFADMLGADLALMTKERPAQQVAEVGYVIGDVRGKTAVILDDIIDTAGTLTAAGQTVLDEGASRVYAACTHAVFSGPAYERLAESAFEQVVVTDTIPLRDGAPDKVVVLSCASLLADTIRQIFTEGSVSAVFGGENQLF
jgi:ribose-phosphate pyrophosphokinase